jgi:PIN domain nuclease of toxin-antitoxin system
MSAVLLDTNAFATVLTDDPRLPRSARERIAAADRAVLSVIWLYEGGQHGRLGKWPEMVLFVAGLLDRADADGFNLLSLSPSAALQASLLAGSTGTRSTA